jgi:hypothetical protein
MEPLRTLPDNAGFLVKFAVDEVLRRSAPDFQDQLLYNLNILQENVGSVDVFASDATLEQFQATVRLAWEILPPGNLEEVIRKILEGKRAITVEAQKTMRDRLRVLQHANPQCYIAGTSEFLRYFGAKFEDDFVAFENINYGNALYIMYENWEALSRRSRIDLLKGTREGFARIQHALGWEDKFRDLLRKHRLSRKRS